MYEYKCQYCGQIKSVKYKKDIKECCSRRCAAMKRNGHSIEEEEPKVEVVTEDYDESLEWKRSKSRLWICPYEVNVECKHRLCSSCGWHPEVKAERNRKILCELEESQ